MFEQDIKFLNNFRRTWGFDHFHARMIEISDRIRTGCLFFQSFEDIYAEGIRLNKYAESLSSKFVIDEYSTILKANNECVLWLGTYEKALKENETNGFLDEKNPWPALNICINPVT